MTFVVRFTAAVWVGPGIASHARTASIWVGGAFSPLSLLPGPLQTIARVNPIFYLIDGFRYAMLGTSEAPVWASLSVTVVLTAIALFVALSLFKRGYKLRA